jgi:hypothetical protein
MSPELEKVVEEAYQLFSQYERGNPMLVCHCQACMGYYNECLLIGDELPRQDDSSSKKHLDNNHSTENRHKRT